MPGRSGWGRRGCGCRLRGGRRLWRGCHVIGVIDAQPGRAPQGPFLALRHCREKAFDAAALPIVYFLANRIFRIVPLSPCRRCGEDHCYPKDQPNRPAHHTPLGACRFYRTQLAASEQVTKRQQLLDALLGGYIRRADFTVMGVSGTPLPLQLGQG